MNYEAPEIVEVGNAQEVIEGLDPDVNEFPGTIGLRTISTDLED